MAVYSIIRLDTVDSRIVQEKFNLDNFSIFSRGTIKSIVRTMVREVATHTKEDRMLEIREKLNDTDRIKIFTQKKELTRVVVITDGEYSSMVGQKLLLEAFRTKDYEFLIKDYYNSEEHNLLIRVEKDLQECYLTVVEGLNNVLERGNNLDELVKKSENLSMQAKLLFRTAKKRNRCC